MRIAVWRTGHEIADTVAEAVKQGVPNGSFSNGLRDADSLIGYGILRGTAEAFRESEARGKPWFNIDRGYFKPRHFDGYYRISLRGTQHTGAIQDWMLDTKRLDALALDIKPWRGFDHSKPVLVCLSTEHAANFFNVDKTCILHDYHWHDTGHKKFIIRQKSDTSPIIFSDYNYVLTFNSSVGWQALQAGIPCVSDPTHSMVGKWYHNISLDKLADAQYADRHKLFAAMANLQLSLQEMRDGMLWPLMSKLLSHEQPT